MKIIIGLITTMFLTLNVTKIYSSCVADGIYAIFDNEATKLKGYIYVVNPPAHTPQITSNTFLVGWKSFHLSAFELPSLLERIGKIDIPLIVCLPANYHKVDTLSLEGPWLEGARVALAWSSAYFRFKELNNVNVRILLVKPEDLASKQNFFKVMLSLLSLPKKNFKHKTPEENFEESIYYFSDFSSQFSQTEINSLILKEAELYITNEKDIPNFKGFAPIDSKKTVLISGGTGFIGSHIVKYLISSGFRVIVLDNELCSTFDNISDLQNNSSLIFYNHDVSIPFDVEGRVDFVIHLASAPSPAFYYTKPRETLLAGLQGTKNMLEIAMQKNARFLFASSSEVYGDPEVHPQHESYLGRVNTIGKRSQYDQSKRGAETLIKMYVDRYKVDARIVRIFNTYGPYMNINDGRVITNFMNALFSNKPLIIYGDGYQTRSFAYVTDTVAGILKALFNENLSSYSFADGHVFNIGNPNEFTINQLAKKIQNISEKYFNKSVSIEYIPQTDNDDPKIRRPDISRAENLLGYKPNVHIEEGLEKTFIYFLKK